MKIQKLQSKIPYFCKTELPNIAKKIPKKTVGINRSTTEKTGIITYPPV